MKKITCIKEYFERNGGRQVSLEELKALSDKDRQELAELAAREMGVELE